MTTYEEYANYKQEIYEEMMNYKNNADFDKAYEVVKSGYEYLKDNLGPKDSLTLDLMHLTSSRAKDAGKLDEAIDISKRCYELKEEVYGTLDIRTFQGRNHYIIFSGEKEGYEHAKKELEDLYNKEMELVNQYINKIGIEKTKQTQKKLLELTMMTLFNYANRLSYVGDYWLALRWMKYCYDESKKFVGKNYIITTRAEHNIIDRWINVRNRKEAIKQAIKCYIHRCEYVDEKTHKQLELKHLYSTKAILLELLAYQIYHQEKISDDIKSELQRTDIFPEGYHESMDQLIFKLEEMIEDFMENGEKKTYEELHFKCVLAVLYSYKKNQEYIGILKDVLYEIDVRDYYSNSNVDIVKVYTTMAAHVIHSYEASYKNVTGIKMAEEISKKTRVYLGESNHATLTIMYQMAVMYAEHGNMLEFYQRSSYFFLALSKFISNCIDENDKKSIQQSTEFVSTSFEDYSNRFFNDNSTMKFKSEYIDPLLRYKNMLFDLELFKSNHILKDQNENKFIIRQRKEDYINSLEKSNLTNIQRALMEDFTILDFFDLKNGNYGVLLITNNDYDCLMIRDINELKNHPLLKENVYIAPDGTSYDFDFYLLDKKISFLSLAKNILNYENKKIDIKEIEVYADPKFKLSDEVEYIDQDLNEEHTRGVEQRWSFDGKEISRYLGEIPFSFVEGMFIKKLYKDNCSLFVKEQANVKNFRKVKKCDVLHIATHAKFLSMYKDQDPLEKSRIYLAGYDNCKKNQILPDTFGKGFISAKDIINMDLKDTKIVVLSACESGLGETYDFQGIYGFRRAFELDSVQTLILTTAKINDVMAAYFMENFYHFLHFKGLVYESFLHAQKKVKNATYEMIEMWRKDKKKLIEQSDKVSKREKVIFDYCFTKDNFSKDEWKNYIYVGNRNL